jgi:hypothetical protein
MVPMIAGNKIRCGLQRVTISAPVVFSNRLILTFEHFLIAVTKSKILGVCSHQLNIKIGGWEEAVEDRYEGCVGTFVHEHQVWVVGRTSRGSRVGLVRVIYSPSMLQPISGLFLFIKFEFSCTFLGSFA